MFSSEAAERRGRALWHRHVVVAQGGVHRRRPPVPLEPGFGPAAMHAFQECLLVRVADKSVADGVIVLEGSSDLVSLVA